MKARDRVRIATTKPETWTREAYAAFQGALGTIVSIDTHYPQGAKRDEPYVLVRFDEPIKHGTGAWAKTSMAWHFDASELVLL